MRSWSGTARRLLVAFSALILFFSAATYVSLASQNEIHRRMHQLDDEASMIAASLGIEASAWRRYAGAIDAGLPPDPGDAKWVAALLGEFRTHGAGAYAEELRALESDLRVLDDGSSDTATRRASAVAIRERSRAIVKRLAASVGNFETHAQVTQHEGFRRSLLVLAIAMLLLLAVGYYIHRMVARPIEELGRAAERLGSGDAAVRFDVDGPSEFRQLGKQLAAMTEALRTKQDELVQSERLASVGRLAAGVAHEINNPLGVILGYVRMLEHKATGAMADDLRVVADEALRCQEIVEGLIELSRPPRASDEVIDLRALSEEVAARLAPSQPATAIVVDGVGSAQGSSARLRQVVLNLTKNAVEAAGPEGRVGISIGPSEDGRSVVVAVRDSGPGVAPEVRRRLFEPFVTSKPSGTGLGLAVSQGIAQAHGGHIELADVSGGGAVARLVLPIAADDAR